MKRVIFAMLSASLLALGSPVMANEAAANKPDPEKLLATCAACHATMKDGKADFTTPSQPVYPVLAGQYEDYLYQAMRSYRINNKMNFGRNNATMVASIKVLDGKNEPETDRNWKAVAKYLSKLPSKLETVK